MKETLRNKTLKATVKVVEKAVEAELLKPVSNDSRNLILWLAH
jgi:hypothetical protein